MSRYRRSRIQGGTFFFTVTLVDRTSRLLIERIDDLRAAYGEVQRKHSFKMLAICVMPDHIHAIWELPYGDADFSSRWSRIKSGFSRGQPAAERTARKIAKREKGIWQRRFWEHQIRDERDLQRHIDYVHHNPVKHGWVNQVVDWPHSSFHRYVKAGWLPSDWGGEGVEDLNVGER